MCNEDTLKFYYNELCKEKAKNEEILETVKNEIVLCVKHHKKIRDIDQELYIQEKGFIDGLREAVKIIKRLNSRKEVSK